MALGFGKKKAEEAAPAAPAPQNGSPAGESADFDADTFALDQFANDLEAAGSSSGFGDFEQPAAAQPASNSGDPLAWDDTSLLSFDDPGTFDATTSHARAGARGAGGEITPFDDLARELEDIPSIASPDFDIAPPAASLQPEIPERKTRRKAVSADLTAPGVMGGPETGAKKAKKVKEPRVGAPEGTGRKLPIKAIVGGVVGLVVLLGVGVFILGGKKTDDTGEDLPRPVATQAKPAESSEGQPAPADTAPVGSEKPGAVPAKPAAAPPKPADLGKPGAKPPVLSKPGADPAQLKSLWDRGAAAKHAKDFEGARKAWMEMLKLDPGHVGVQEAIDKLPKKK